MTADGALRGFLARMLGFAAERSCVVDRAVRSVELAASRRAALVICGEGDVVPLARALHRRTLGAVAPFVLCDPRRGNTQATVRSPANHESGRAAFMAARDGTLCMRAHRLPRDFGAVVELLREPNARVQLVVCWPRAEAHPLLVSPSPIVVPPLRDRAGELAQIVDEHAADAINALGAPAGSFRDVDRVWILDHAAGSLEEIEKATLRIVALATSPNVSRAAARLEMTQVSLVRWIDRRAATQAPTALATPAPDELAAYFRPRARPRRRRAVPQTVRGPRRAA